jgi:benzoate/toluate 1,2-dioxygenase alpha subunit
VSTTTERPIDAERVRALVSDEPDAGRFRLHRDVYTDPDIFDQEMRVFFEHGWVYLAHESQVQHPNDYLTLHIGRQPVILARDGDGQLRALLNRCMHRGASVCRVEQGNSARFRCFYHGWTYKNTGELVGVADRGGYPPEFDLNDIALRTVPRLESYKGFVFASLDPDVVSLEEHLGNARAYFDVIVDKYPTGIEVAHGATRYGYAGNWKLQVENALDFYHVPTTHKSFLDVMKARGRDISAVSNYSNMARDSALYLGNGHGSVVSRMWDGDGHIDPATAAALGTSLPPETAELAASLHQHLLVFPNVVFLEHPGPQIRVIRPLAVDRTEIRGYAFFSPDVAEDVRQRQLRAYEVFYGPAGMGSPDDIEAFEACTAGYQAAGAPWNDLSRGLHRERRSPCGLDLEDIGNFELAGNITDDTVYRGLYRWWAETMVERGSEAAAL